MIDLVQQQSEAIAALCRKYQVRTLELFGSAAAGRFDHASSDVDFLVEFDDLGWERSFKRYMGLKLDLEDLLGRSVDLVEAKAVTNPYFLRKASEARELVFAA
jgi:predicted nucleotidyltransferase